MPLNDTGLTLLATTLQGALQFAQLHSGPAGDSYMDNIAVPGRQPLIWDMPSPTFGLVSLLNFTDGEPGSDVYSITVWDAETDGVCYGEHPLDGDATFNSIGEFQVTAIDVRGTSTDT